MRRCLILLALGAAVLAPRAALAIAASQAWVEAFVSNYVANCAAMVESGAASTHTNGVTVTTAGGVRLEVQDFSDAALMATNCTPLAAASSVTNGTLFVWNGALSYLNPSGAISVTPTNFVFNAVGSVYTNGVDRFEGLFDVIGVLIQPDTSLAITNALTESHQ